MPAEWRGTLEEPLAWSMTVAVRSASAMRPGKRVTTRPDRHPADDFEWPAG